MRGRADGWIERMEDESVGGEGMGREAHLWFSVGFHYYGYCVVRFRICKVLTVQSPAGGSTFFIKVRLSLNYSLCLPACPLAPVHPEREEAWKRMTASKNEWGDKTTER